MKLLILSDIYGGPKEGAMLEGLLSGGPYSGPIATFEDVTFLDLATVSGSAGTTGDQLHHHLYENGGFEIASNALQGAQFRDYIGLGYSAGGSVLWNAVASGLGLRSLYCVSSTRLREVSKPLPIPVHCYFGSNDDNRPTDSWGEKLPASMTVFCQLNHGFYYDPSTTQMETVLRDIAAEEVEMA